MYLPFLLEFRDADCLKSSNLFSPWFSSQSKLDFSQNRVDSFLGIDFWYTYIFFRNIQTLIENGSISYMTPSFVLP